MKKLVLGTAIGALMISSALAQQPSAAPDRAITATPPASSTATGIPARNVVTSQSPDQWLASKFSGTDVIGVDNQKIGDVNDIVFDQSGKISAYVVGVGGFLGVGAKDVALSPESFEVIKGENGQADKLKLAMSKDELKAAQEFAAYQPARTTTGMAPARSGTDRQNPPIGR